MPVPMPNTNLAVLVKDESSRLGLPAFKVLGASWAVEETSLEDIVLAYLGQQARESRAQRREMEVAR